jgi:hypothetical protein
VDAIWVRRYLGEAAKGVHPSPTTWNYQYVRPDVVLGYLVRGLAQIHNELAREDDQGSEEHPNYDIGVSPWWLHNINSIVVEAWAHFAPALKGANPEIKKVGADFKKVMAQIQAWLKSEKQSTKWTADEPKHDWTVRIDSSEFAKITRTVATLHRTAEKLSKSLK